MTIISSGTPVSLTLPSYTPTPPPQSSPAVVALEDISWNGDLVIDASGDLTIVTGKAAFLQHLLMLAVSPQGSFMLDPEYGDGLVGLIGQPRPSALTLQGLANSLSSQIVAFGTGDGVGVPTISSGTIGSDNVNGILTLSITVSFPDNTSQDLTIPLLQGTP